VGRLVADLGARVTGVDLSPRSAALAQRLNATLRVVAADMRAPPVATGVCAGVVAFYSLIDTADPSPTLAELRRVLQPGGALLIAVHAGEGAGHYDSYKGVPVDIELHLHVPEVLAARVRSAGFTLERAEVRSPDPFEHPTSRLYVSATAEACRPTG
jgi:uncharacterized protein